MILDRRILFVVCAILPLGSAAQTSPVFRNSYENLSFRDFAARVEAESDFFFYYRPSWIDTIRVDIPAGSYTITALLDHALANTELHFSIGDNTIFITHDQAIQVELPPGFFPDEGRGHSTQLDFDFTDYEGREAREKAIQEKVFNIGRTDATPGPTATITGIVRDFKSGEPLAGAAVLIMEPFTGSTTDQSGYYSLSLPKGKHALHIQSIGMKNTVRQIQLLSDGRLDIEMEEDITPLREVVIESDRDALVRDVQMGITRLDIKTMKQIPLALGETDILKVILTLPGVQSAGEGTVGLNVRGGATNQNLILLNDAVVYNPSHLFGFFSTFNPDVLKNVELYKSGINADFGGRLSSVLDVHTREGNQKKISGSGGISPITGRLTVEGPIRNEKTTFIVGARSTYSSWLLRKLDDPALNKSSASFYDVTGAVTHQINDNNTINISGYLSNDQFNLASDTVYGYHDRNAVVKWKHIFNPKLSGAFTAATSEYAYDITSTENPANAFAMDFSIQQLNGKFDLSYFPNPRHTIMAGGSTIRYSLLPGSLQPVGGESIIAKDIIAREQALESAFYISDQFELSRRLTLYGGLRYSFYDYLGPRDVYVYGEGSSRQTANIVDTIAYGAGKSVARYGGIEPRLSLRYGVGKKGAVKVSYNRMRQYIQMLTNTASMTPTDVWKLADTYIRPQFGDQYSVGFYQYLNDNIIELSVEGYYKTIHDAVDFRNGARLILNHQMETAVLDAEGKAYGAEFLVKKSTGKLNGWISYSWSRTFLRTRAQLPYESVNRGEYYPAPYDKPHAVNFIGNYKFSRRFNFSLNLIYSTGRPVTLPIAKFDNEGTERIYYSDRNQYRIPDYFRSDISINVEGNHKVKKLAHSSWTFAIYNVTGRKNPFSVFFVSDGGKVAGYKLSVFARPIPTITYNFRF